MVVWITGLSGAGKTSIASLLLAKLKEKGLHAILLDGDNLRDALQQHAYDENSRKELGLTYSRLCKMFSEQGTITICATVAMFDIIRDWNRTNIANYFEVYVKVDNETLIHRNKKKLYSKSIDGTVKNFYGFDIKIEKPKSPDLIVENNNSSCIDDHVTKIINNIM